MTDSDSLRGDIDRHTNLPQCCGELEILRALLRPRMAEAGDPTPTEALRGMFIEIERLRVTTSEGARCRALEESLTAVKHTLQTLRGRLHELLQLSMDGASDRDIFERIESLKAKLAEERKRTNILAETSTAEAKLARAAADGHDHAQALLLAISEVFGRVDDLDSLPAKVRELSDNCLHNFNKAARLQARVDEQDTRGTLPGPLPVSAQALMSGDRICAGTCTLLDLAKARSQALNVLGWSGADDPLEWAEEARRLADERIDVLQAELGVHAAAIADAEIQTEKLVAALSEKTAALDAVPTQIAALKDAADAAHAAMKRLGWDGSTYPDEWAQTTAAHYKAVRDALGVPADKPIIPYAQHAAKGMQALAILGWKDSHPVEWATKRAAAEADLRGAFAEAELVGSDHAAMVRQLWGNLRRTSAQHLAVIEERNAQIDECAVLRSVITERNARIHQLEIDNSKVHLEGRIELAEKRLSMWRAWVVGMCPESTVPANMTDDDLRVAMTFISTEEYNRAIKALQDELARQRSLVSVMVDIKRRLVALKDLSM